MHKVTNSVSRRKAVGQIAGLLTFGGWLAPLLEGCGGGGGGGGGNGSGAEPAETTRATGKSVAYGKYLKATAVISPYDTSSVDADGAFTIRVHAIRPCPLFAFDSEGDLVGIAFSQPDPDATAAAIPVIRPITMDSDSAALFFAAAAAGRAFNTAAELEAFRTALEPKNVWTTVKHNTLYYMEAGSPLAQTDGLSMIGNSEPFIYDPDLADPADVAAGVTGAADRSVSRKTQKTAAPAHRAEGSGPNQDGFDAALIDTVLPNATTVSLLNAKPRTLKVFRRSVAGATIGALTEPTFTEAALPDNQMSAALHDFGYGLYHPVTRIDTLDFAPIGGITPYYEYFTVGMGYGNASATLPDSIPAASLQAELFLTTLTGPFVYPVVRALIGPVPSGPEGMLALMQQKYGDAFMSLAHAQSASLPDAIAAAIGALIAKADFWQDVLTTLRNITPSVASRLAPRYALAAQSIDALCLQAHDLTQFCNQVGPLSPVGSHRVDAAPVLETALYTVYDPTTVDVVSDAFLRLTRSGTSATFNETPVTVQSVNGDTVSLKLNSDLNFGDSGVLVIYDTSTVSSGGGSPKPAARVTLTMPPAFTFQVSTFATIHPGQASITNPAGSLSGEASVTFFLWPRKSNGSTAQEYLFHPDHSTSGPWSGQLAYTIPGSKSDGSDDTRITEIVSPTGDPSIVCVLTYDAANATLTFETTPQPALQKITNGDTVHSVGVVPSLYGKVMVTGVTITNQGVPVGHTATDTTEQDHGSASFPGFDVRTTVSW